MNIVIYGNSKKFINIIEAIFPDASLKVIAWRQNIDKLNADVIPKEMAVDLLVVCGYDYGATFKSWKVFIQNNINYPEQIITELAPQTRSIIYIDTEPPAKLRTYSRYQFAKFTLGQRLAQKLNQLSVMPVATIHNKDGLVIHGGVVNQIAFYICWKLGMMKTISTKEIQNMIYEQYNRPILGNEFTKPICPCFLKIPRPLLIDRILRILYG